MFFIFHPDRVGQDILNRLMMIADEKLAILGSANMDMRSLLLNYEVGVLITSQQEVEQVSDWLEELMQGCGEGVESVSAIGEVGEGLARLLAPQL